ncbi:hypothetical protein [Streptomyces sp. SID10815]|uniref:hypothetical protein n=1 Tax=Streptomyces sp. SID10815 TaxID=2706027 RepID=UPI0013C663D6|nr:hypothetical protein [Streptomyces sp. SID10815]NEA52389.1 hypothetical protein [Streptomyces sp. SID10815]
MPKFQIITTSGRSYGHGESRWFDMFSTTQTLESYDHEGDYVVLRYSNGIKDAIPEAQVAHIITA